MEFNGLGTSLSDLARLSKAKSRAISMENVTGEKGKGGAARRVRAGNAPATSAEAGKYRRRAS